MVDYIKAGFERAAQSEGEGNAAAKTEPAPKQKVQTWMYVVCGASLVTLAVAWAMQPETPEAKLAREQQRQKEWNLIVLSCEATSQTQLQLGACVELARQAFQSRN
jgi:hypothetical protein